MPRRNARENIDAAIARHKHTIADAGASLRHAVDALLHEQGSAATVTKYAEQVQRAQRALWDLTGLWPGVRQGAWSHADASAVGRRTAEFWGRGAKALEHGRKIERAQKAEGQRIARAIATRNNRKRRATRRKRGR
jgi:hypothetical protein